MSIDPAARDAQNSPVLIARGLRKTFSRGSGDSVEALAGVSLTAERGMLTALVGPDGAGKTTLMRLVTGLVEADTGELTVCGIDVKADPQNVQSRVGYMPQRFGLYEDLSVQENLDLYSDMHGLTGAERRDRYPQLLEMTALEPFVDRLAGRLSGGMKQKLGLACTLVRWPELLVLDEPTVGVDPLSRRELWAILLDLVHTRGLSVLVSTSYLDEAERCGRVVVMHEGKVLSEGPPESVTALAEGRTFVAAPPAGHKARDLQAKMLDDWHIIDAVPEAGHVRYVLAESASDHHALPAIAALADAKVEPVKSRFEDGFMVLLRRSIAEHSHAGSMTLEHKPELKRGDAVVKVRDLVRRFGAFTAVDHVSFEVERGEIFGLLGPNGAGKTTTFRMLCGLLPATGGTLEIAGIDVRKARASARERIGYVAQKFSLYSQLSVQENLDFFASAYGLRGDQKERRLEWGLREFGLESLTRLPSGQLPGGFKQRLAMAAALLHEPEILFLDEPTSGADPLARREFWRRITSLAEQGVTVIVTTHFMEEAEYCDHVAILDSGRVLAQGSPAEIRSHARVAPPAVPSMEDAFIAIVEQARAQEAHAPATKGGAA